MRLIEALLYFTALLLVFWSLKENRRLPKGILEWGIILAAVISFIRDF